MTLWTLSEGRLPAPPGTAAPTTIMTLGYDPRVGRFLGTFIGSMMTHQWIYEGSLNAARTVLTLDTEGPDPVREGKLAKYQDLIEMNGDDHRILRSRYQAENGEWRDFMRCDYRRNR